MASDRLGRRSPSTCPPLWFGWPMTELTFFAQRLLQPRGPPVSLCETKSWQLLPWPPADFIALRRGVPAWAHFRAWHLPLERAAARLVTRFPARLRRAVVGRLRHSSLGSS